MNQVSTDSLAPLVADLYERVWADPELGPYFHRTDRERQRQRLNDFLAEALGGGRVDIEELRRAHAGRGIQHEHFSLFACFVVDVLADHGYEEETSDHLLDLVARVRDAVVEEPVADVRLLR